MHINEKINLKRYLISSLLVLATAYPFTKTTDEFLVILVIFFAVIINQWLLITYVDASIKNTLGNEAQKKGKLLFSFFLKSLVIVIAVSFGVHIMGNRIIIPILIYVIQIFILYFSMIKKEPNS